MKTRPRSLCISRSALTAGLLFVAAQSASALSPRASIAVPQQRTSSITSGQITAQSTSAHTETPAEALLGEIKPTPYNARAALQEKLKAGEARFAEKLPEWQAKKDALPDGKKSEAEAIFKQLVTDREVLRQKIEGVEDAQAETWNSAKSELYTALQNTISTYNRLKVIFES